MDMGAMEEFRDLYLDYVEQSEKLIFELKTNERYKSATTQLFRLFHSLKALTGYLNIMPSYKVIKTVEDVLCILRHKKPPVSNEVVDWLLIVNDHILGWQQAIEKQKFDEIEPLDAFTLNMVRSAVTITKKGSDLLKERSILIIDSNAERGILIQKLLKSRVKVSNIATTPKEAASYIQLEKADIIISTFDMIKPNPLELMKKLRAKLGEVPLLMYSEKGISMEHQLPFRRVGVEQFVSNVFGVDALLQKLSIIAKAYFDSKSIKLINSPLLSRIEELPPLPETIKDIQRIKDDPKTTLKEISDVITRDATLVAKILKLVNSPSLGLRGEINSVHHAITMLGKEMVIAICVQAAAESVLKIDLKPYGLDQETFYRVAFRRMELMTHWYKKVSLSSTATLATAALLGNIGQIAISESLIRNGKGPDFNQLLNQTENPMLTELEFLHTTAEDASADILTHWGLDDSIVNAIRYSFDLGNADNEIKPLALAIYAVFNTVPSLSPKIEDDKADEMADLLGEMNMDPALFLNAVARVKTKK